MSNRLTGACPARRLAVEQERGDWAVANISTAALGIAAIALSAAYVEAAGWADAVTS